MMHGWGMVGFGIFPWIIDLIITGLVVYVAVKLALKQKN